MYTDGHAVAGLRYLPLNLLDAIRAFEGSEMLRDAFGAEWVASYARLKMAEWQDYMRCLTDWERERTLDC
jgi:glutamine synthetase